MFVQYFAIVYACMLATIVYMLFVMVLRLIKCLGFHAVKHLEQLFVLNVHNHIMIKFHSL